MHMEPFEPSVPAYVNKDCPECRGTNQVPWKHTFGQGWEYVSCIRCLEADTDRMMKEIDAKVRDMRKKK